MKQVNWIDDKSAKQGTHIDLTTVAGLFVPMVGGSMPTRHPVVANVKDLLQPGHITRGLSMELKGQFKGLLRSQIGYLYKASPTGDL